MHRKNEILQRVPHVNAGLVGRLHVHARRLFSAQFQKAKLNGISSAIDVVPDGKGGELRLITNRFDLTAMKINDIYQFPWAIELFFKWVKQNVNIKHFYGQSEKALKNQIYLVLIAYCLNVLIQVETKSEKSILTITRLLKTKLWTDSRHWLCQIENQAVP